METFEFNVTSRAPGTSTTTRRQSRLSPPRWRDRVQPGFWRIGSVGSCAAQPALMTSDSARDVAQGSCFKIASTTRIAASPSSRPAKRDAKFSNG